MPYSILVLNTGSTSTKLAVYRDQERQLQKEYTHSAEFLRGYPTVADQLPMRQRIAEAFVENDASAFAPFDTIVARGGILCPIHSGGYSINEAMLDYLAHSAQLTDMIKGRVAFIAPILVYPGENEMESLAHGAYRILSGEEEARNFSYH